MNIIFKTNKGNHYKIASECNKWLLSNVMHNDSNINQLDGIGHYEDYIAFKLNNGKYVIVESIDTMQTLQQFIIELTPEQIKEIEYHKWIEI